jgi:hypothetical protein
MKRSRSVIDIVNGIMGIEGNRVFNPSDAETTVMVGVSVAAPIAAMKYAHRYFFRTKANSDKIPPSPRLSVLRITKTYFKVGF